MITLCRLAISTITGATEAGYDHLMLNPVPPPTMGRQSGELDHGALGGARTPKPSDPQQDHSLSGAVYCRLNALAALRPVGDPI